MRNNANPTFKQIIDIFYRVGTYYPTSDKTFDPNTEWGGTWEKLPEGSVIIASNEDKLSNNNKLTVNQLPKHTHTISHKHNRGDMDITGSARLFGVQDIQAASGVFYEYASVGQSDNGHWQSTNSKSLGFQASKNWTGNTSEPTNGSSGDGGFSNTDLTNILKHAKCYIWHRIA